MTGKVAKAELTQEMSCKVISCYAKQNHVKTMLYHVTSQLPRRNRVTSMSMSCLLKIDKKGLTFFFFKERNWRVRLFSLYLHFEFLFNLKFNPTRTKHNPYVFDAFAMTGDSLAR